MLPAATPVPKNDHSLDGRRDMIVQAAYQALVEKGFEGLRTREIAARIGLNHATLHYYFPTKDALVQAVVDHICDVINALHSAEMAYIPDTTPEAKLRFHIGIALGEMERNPELFIAINELRIRAVRDESVKKILGRCDRDWCTSVISILAAGKASGDFRSDLDPAHTTDLLISFLMGLSMQYELDATGRERAAETLLACLICRADG